MASSAAIPGRAIKPVTPARATAKLSFRLVPNQQPAQILDGLHRFIEERLPKDCTASFADQGGSPAVGFDTSTPVFKAAAHALEQEWGKPPLIIIGCGASIPIVEAFRSRLGLEVSAGRFRARRRPHPLPQRKV